MSRDVYNYQRHAIRAARELGYPKEIILRLQSATTEAEIERIINTARKNMK